MRDLRLIVPIDRSVGWTLDFDIINGVPQFVQYERNTQDQRAALAAYTLLGSIPGKPNIGINWGGLYSQSNDTLVNIDNEIKQAIQEYTAVPDDPTGQYVPVYNNEDGAIQLSIMQG